MRRFAVLFLTIALLACTGAAAAATRGTPPQFPHLAGRWSHAEINVTIKKQQHTLVLDHGRITAISPSQLTLREFDGTSHTIGLTTGTLVTLAGRPTAVGLLWRGLYAQTMIVDDGAAVRVRATYRP
jgi:hypothetical protein